VASVTCGAPAPCDPPPRPGPVRMGTRPWR